MHSINACLYPEQFTLLNYLYVQAHIKWYKGAILIHAVLKIEIKPGHLLIKTVVNMS